MYSIIIILIFLGVCVHGGASVCTTQGTKLMLCGCMLDHLVCSQCWCGMKHLPKPLAIIGVGGP